MIHGSLNNFPTFNAGAVRVLRLRIFLLIAVAIVGENAFAQDLSLPNGIAPVPDDLGKRHMTPTGKPCLAIQGYAKQELVNKNIYQHLIRTANNCVQNIKVRVCYYNTDDCILVNVPPLERREDILGIFPALKRFQFQAKEQF
jgi:hypothetical protein